MLHTMYSPGQPNIEIPVCGDYIAFIRRLHPNYTQCVINSLRGASVEGFGERAAQESLGYARYDSDWRRISSWLQREEKYL